MPTACESGLVDDWDAFRQTGPIDVRACTMRSVERVTGMLGARDGTGSVTSRGRPEDPLIGVPNDLAGRNRIPGRRPTACGWHGRSTRGSEPPHTAEYTQTTSSAGRPAELVARSPATWTLAPSKMANPFELA